VPAQILGEERRHGPGPGLGCDIRAGLTIPVARAREAKESAEPQRSLWLTRGRSLVGCSHAAVISERFFQHAETIETTGRGHRLTGRARQTLDGTCREGEGGV
jgi:hypothetical protein